MVKLYKKRMNERTYGTNDKLMLAFAPTPRVMDKKGLAVALLFLFAAAIWAVERTEKASDLPITWQRLPALSDHLEIRMAFATEKARHFILPTDEYDQDES